MSISLPDEIHKHVGRGDFADGSGVFSHGASGATITGVNGQDENDAQNDGTDGGRHVINDGPRADATRK